MRELNLLRNTSQTSTAVTARSELGKLAPTRMIASRSSLASSTRSKNSGSGVRATVGHKRGVRYHRRRCSGNQRKISADVKPDTPCQGNHTEIRDNGSNSSAKDGAFTSAVRSKKGQGISSTALLPAAKAGGGSQIWTEDVRKLSSSLAMDCDQAFNRSDIDIRAKESDTLRPSGIMRKSSPLSTQTPVNAQESMLASLDDRPLPPPPTQSELMRIELLEAQKQAEPRMAIGGEDSSKYLDRMVNHIDRFIQRPPHERRISSAPAESKFNTIGLVLPSIRETGKEQDSPHRLALCDEFLEHQKHGFKSSRTGSAPEPREKSRHHENRFLKSHFGIRDTIRLVEPSSPGPVKVPAPLTIRKKSSYGGQTASSVGVFSANSSRSSSNATRSGVELRQQYYDLQSISEDHVDHSELANHSSSGTVVKNKQTWFKRSSKHEDNDFMPPTDRTEPPYIHPLLPVPSKNKGFNFGQLFKKSKPDMTIGGKILMVLLGCVKLTCTAVYEIEDDNISLPDSAALSDIQCRTRNKRFSNSSGFEKRQIEPQQNWFAKLFNVKPASKVICFSVSERRARQEIVTVLKEWKRYGIRELQIDKRANRVFGKVAAKNCKLAPIHDFRKLTSTSPGHERSGICRRSHEDYRAWKKFPPQHCPLYSRIWSC